MILIPMQNARKAVETAPQEDSSMPSEGDYNDWYEYFRRFFGG